MKRYSGLAGWFVAAVVLVLGAGRSEEIRAKRLVIEDGEGAARITIETHNGHPRIIMSTADGKTGWSAGVMPNGHGWTLAIDPAVKGVQVP